MFYSFLLACDILVVLLIFLDSEKTFLSCFLLDSVYPISITFSIEKWCLNIIKVTLKIDNTFNDMGTLIILRHYFSIEKVIDMGYTLSRRKQGRKVFSKSKKRRSTTNISHVNSNKSNNKLQCSAID